MAGNGSPGDSGDGGKATAAELLFPTDVALDGDGDLFIADPSSNVVREVNLSTSVITTVAGNGTAGYNGDGGQATDAELSHPTGVTVDAFGDLFIADLGNNCIREVDLDNGVIGTFAGNGTYGYSGDGASHRRRIGLSGRRGRGRHRRPLHRRLFQQLHPRGSRRNPTGDDACFERGVEHRHVRRRSHVDGDAHFGRCGSVRRTGRFYHRRLGGGNDAHRQQWSRDAQPRRRCDRRRRPQRRRQLRRSRQLCREHCGPCQPHREPGRADIDGHRCRRDL